MNPIDLQLLQVIQHERLMEAERWRTARLQRTQRPRRRRPRRFRSVMARIPGWRVA